MPKSNPPFDPTGNPNPPPPGPIVGLKRALTVPNGVVKFWDSVRSNPFFVAFEGGALGAAGNFIYDAVQAGNLDFSAAGLKKLVIFALVGGGTAVRLLYRPQPNPTVVVQTPGGEIKDAAAKLVPVDKANTIAQPTGKDQQ